MNIVVLCGGVGGSKLVLGLHEEFPDDEITVIVNTGDDLTFLGLRICPDLDTVMYTLAGIVNPETGWGLADDSFRALSMLEKFGSETWFHLGDGDLATHLVRTQALRAGASLTKATDTIRRHLGVNRTLLPMTDSDVRTKVRVPDGWLDFQEYFVKRRHKDVPLEVEHRGISEAHSTSETETAIETADLIVAAPSNPVVSVGPILAIPGVMEQLKRSKAKRIAVSPFVGSASVTGPADALMRAIGQEPTSAGLARLYAPWANTLVIHESDGSMRPEIEETGTSVKLTDTIMPDLDAKRRLAHFVVDAAR